MATKLATKAELLAKSGYQNGYQNLLKPKGGIMGISTDTAIKKVINDAKNTGVQAQPKIDGCNGLFLRVRPNGQKVTATFCHRYTHPITKKRITITLGTYPALTLANARQLHHDNLTLLANNTDPQEHRTEQRQQEQLKRQNILSVFIDEWERNNPTDNLKPSSIKARQKRMAIVRQKLGNMEITAITPQTVISFVNGVQKERGTSWGGLVLGTLKGVLQIAVVKGLIPYNPATNLTGTYQKHIKKHYPAITDPNKLTKLLQDIDKLNEKGKSYQKQALQLLTLIFARVDDICSMRWQDLDLDNRLWSFAPKKSGGRNDMMTNLVIPLPMQAIKILQSMQDRTKKYPFVFAKPRNKKGYVSTSTIDGELRKMGYKGLHCPHGFRATGKTILMERLGYDELITELQLGHKMLNKYGKAYSRFDMLDQRKQMLQVYADYLDNLKSSRPPE